jgi:hypothetical protein
LKHLALVEEREGRIKLTELGERRYLADRLTSAGATAGKVTDGLPSR